MKLDRGERAGKIRRLRPKPLPDFPFNLGKVLSGKTRKTTEEAGPLPEGDPKPGQERSLRLKGFAVDKNCVRNGFEQ
ncbi:Hypothetical protein NTJ_10696 [Nesidiocoris tenuis]|uniref:Uncharacterized protein n=1 Tax=Nesidiocoris tenuis TaxID=355587 RepID=A0ABN7B549_9HEMI|nr:Hypothetical protein NTJ_10696 [Nesidiocoris tenuis]